MRTLMVAVIAGFALLAGSTETNAQQVCGLPFKRADLALQCKAFNDAIAEMHRLGRLQGTPEAQPKRLYETQRRFFELRDKINEHWNPWQREYDI